jgi:hypothetical protein
VRVVSLLPAATETVTAWVGQTAAATIPMMVIPVVVKSSPLADPSLRNRKIRPGKRASSDHGRSTECNVPIALTAAIVPSHRGNRGENAG